MKHILAFGDSNTWGMIPGIKPPKRYPDNVRWTGILRKKCKNAKIIEEGLCGRTVMFEDTLRPGRKGISALPHILEDSGSLDAAVIMLGTNDCKPVYKATADVIGSGIEQCLNVLEKHMAARSILLISPIYLGKNVWRDDKDPEFDPNSVELCRKLEAVYSLIANRRGVPFLAASDYASPNEADEEHLDETGHRLLAEAVYKKLKEMGVV